MRSPFKKDKKDKEGLDADETLEDEGEGLLMSAGGQGAEDASNDSAAAEPASSEPAADDLLDAASEDAGSSAGGDDDLVAAAAPSPASSTEEEAKPAESGGGGGGGGTDDFLAAFRDSEVESDSSDLLKGVEDISMEEIMTDLREVRELLGITGPVAVADDGEDDE